MRAFVAQPDARRKMLIATGAGLILLFLAYTVAHGTLRGFAIGLAVALAIPFAYVALERPLLFPFGMYAALVPFEDILSFGKLGTLEKFLGILACGAMLFALVRKGQLVKPSPGVLAWLAVVVWMGVSGSWTLDLKTWQDAYITVGENFLLYALLAMTITTTRELEWLGTCIVVGGLLAAATALWPFMHGVSEAGRLVLPGADRFNHPDPNRFAASLLLPLGILFAATLRTRTALPLIVNIGALGLLAVTIVLTGSRSAMLAILILVVYMVIRSRSKFGLFTLLALAAMAAVPFATTIHSRWAIALSTGGAGRTDIWRVAWAAFKDHWLFGTGYGSFQTAFDQYVLQTPLQAYIGWHRAPHNMVISTGVQLGIIGLILVVGALIFVFRDLAIPKPQGFIGVFKTALEGTLLAIFVDALFLDIVETKFLWLLFIMIALVRSTIISEVASEQRRRTTCATISSLTPAPTSVPETLSA